MQCKDNKNQIKSYVHNVASLQSLLKYFRNKYIFLIDSDE